MQAEKALKARQMDFEDKLDKIYAEKLETLKKANTRLVRQIGGKNILIRLAVKRSRQYIYLIYYI